MYPCIKAPVDIPGAFSDSAGDADAVCIGLVLLWLSPWRQIIKLFGYWSWIDPSQMPFYSFN